MAEHKTSVFLGLTDRMSPGLRRISGNANRLTTALARVGTVGGGAMSTGLRAGMAGLSGISRGATGAIGVLTRLGRTAMFVAGLLATVGGGLAFKGLMAGANRQAAAMGLANIEGGARRAASAMADLKKIAKGPGINLEDALAGYGSLRAVRAPGGLAKGLIAEMGNAVAVAGGGAEELQAVLRGVVQTFGKGVIAAEELNQQILEPAPMIRRAIEAAFGSANTEKIAKEMKRRGLTVTQFWERVLVQMRKLPRAGDGAKNAIENVGIALNELAVSFGQGLLGRTGAGAIGKLAEWIEGLAPLAQKMGAGVRRGIDIVLASLSRLQFNFKLAWMAMKLGWTFVLPVLDQRMVLLAEAVQWLTDRLPGLSGGLRGVWRNVVQLSKDFATAWREILHPGSFDAQTLIELDPRAVDAARWVSGVVDAIRDAWAKVKAGDWFGIGFNLGEALGNLLQGLGPFGDTLIGRMISYGVDAGRGFVTGLASSFGVDTDQEGWFGAMIDGWLGKASDKLDGWLSIIRQKIADWRQQLIADTKADIKQGIADLRNDIVSGIKDSIKERAKELLPWPFNRTPSGGSGNRGGVRPWGGSGSPGPSRAAPAGPTWGERVRDAGHTGWEWGKDKGRRAWEWRSNSPMGAADRWVWDQAKHGWNAGKDIAGDVGRAGMRAAEPIISTGRTVVEHIVELGEKAKGYLTPAQQADFDRHMANWMRGVNP